MNINVSGRDTVRADGDFDIDYTSRFQLPPHLHHVGISILVECPLCDTGLEMASGFLIEYTGLQTSVTNEGRLEGLAARWFGVRWLNCQ